MSCVITFQQASIDVTDITDVFRVLGVIGMLSPLVPTNGLLLVLIAETLDRVDTVHALDGGTVT